MSSVTSDDGLTAKEYIVIGICSLILGLIYVASVFLYLHVKKQKSRHSSTGSTTGTRTIGKPDFHSQNDQVTYGNGFGSSNGNYGRTENGARMSDRRNSSQRNLPMNGLAGEELGIVKNNPLLKHYPNLSDNSGFISDLSNSASECDDERAINQEMLKNVSLIRR